MGNRIRLQMLSCACALGLLAVIAAPAGAGTAVAPEVITGAATNVTASSAVVSGAIGPNGYTIDYEFRYGTTPKFGQTTPVTTLPSQSQAVTVYATLSHLEAKTTYYYQLVAVTATYYNGYYYYPGAYYFDGATASFTTKAGTASKGSVSLTGTKLKVKGHDASVGLKCKSSSACRGSVTLNEKLEVKGHSRTKKIGSAHFSIKANHKGTVKVKLSSAALSSLRTAKHHTVKATATAKPSSGQKGVKNKKVSLKG